MDIYKCPKIKKIKKSFKAQKKQIICATSYITFE